MNQVRFQPPNQLEKRKCSFAFPRASSFLPPHPFHSPLTSAFRFPRPVTIDLLFLRSWSDAHAGPAFDRKKCSERPVAIFEGKIEGGADERTSA